MPAQEASALLNRSLCQKMAESAGFGEVFEAEHRVSENPELEMLWAEYVQFDDTPRLRIVAGKARKVDSKLVDVEEVIFPDNPEIVYVPFRRQYKNALSFLEIDLLTGDALLSTSKLAFGANYDKEFDEFIKLISGFIRVNHAGRRTLSTAVRKINGGLTGCDRHACEMHTPQQNKLLARGRSSTSDFGLDPDVLPYLVAGQLMDHVFSNCSWLPCDGLAQKVHTHIYAPKGEITIIHQVGEEEARHVLQRVEQIN
ncbi:MAG: hypothetical protein EOP06_05930 [Proteobacteria bacterium]|nr:MAG: hypothetical protein EOP06_05930 [Pseudomonadota bacterium]